MLTASMNTCLPECKPHTSVWAQVLPGIAQSCKEPATCPRFLFHTDIKKNKQTKNLLLLLISIIASKSFMFLFLFLGHFGQCSGIITGCTLRNHCWCALKIRWDTEESRGIGPGLAMGKANALPAVLSLLSLTATNSITIPPIVHIHRVLTEWWGLC